MNNFSLIPLNDFKIPVIKEWKPFQTEIAPEEPAKKHANKGGNLGVVTGHLKYFLEVIDVDCKYDITGDLWTKLKAAIPDNIFNQLAIQKTVNEGYHLFYIRESMPDGNQKLAQRTVTKEEKAKNPNDKVRTLIETRGAGGYICIYPSKGYKWIQKSIKNIPAITDKQADFLLSICRQFNQVYKDAYTPKQKVFEDYKRRGDSIEFLLSSASWELVKSNGEYKHFRRPGKDFGISGSIINGEQFKCFTTSSGFDTDKTYDNVAVFTQLNANGNYQESRKLLEQKGYGEPVIKKIHPKTDITQKSNEDEINEDWEKFLKSTEELKEFSLKQVVELASLVENVEGETVIFDSSLVGIQGSYGTGKSRIAQSIGAVILRNDPRFILSGFKINKLITQKPVLVYIDTERNKKTRFLKAVQQIKKNAGFDPEEDVQDFEFSSLREVKRSSRRRIVQNYLEHIREKHEGRKLFFILDISTDMVKTFNDEVDSMEFLDFINNLIDKYESTGLLVIHTNRGGQEALGHLGAELDRKVTSKLSIEKVKDDKSAVMLVMKKNNEGPLMNDVMLRFDKETDSFQYDMAGTNAKGINREVIEAMHQCIGIGERVPLKALKERLREQIIHNEGKEISSNTIGKDLVKIAKNMVPVSDKNDMILGYLLRDSDRKGRSNVTYYELVKK